MDRFGASLAKKGMGQKEPHKHIVHMASTYGNVFDKEPSKLPDISTQKKGIVKFLTGYAKITKYDDFEVGEDKGDN
jgi:hypothetical protein